jgi:molecular chaperone GrpE
MIENQSDKVENLEENVSEDVKNNENSSVNENQISHDKQLPEIDDEKTYADDLKDTITNNDARLEQLEKEHETLKGQYVRIAADFDNFRKRQSRDQDDLKVQLVSKALTAILPIVDNFERARQQLNPEGEEAQALHRSYQGLYKQLVEVLKNLGVAPMRVVDQAFDPSLHEAVMREPSDEKAEDIVIEELQRGYHLNGRVLRHALVKVSMGPGPKAVNEEISDQVSSNQELSESVDGSTKDEN